MGGSLEYQHAVLTVVIGTGVFIAILLLLWPLIERRRRRILKQKLHARIEKAKADILEDGVVELPTGPRAPHIRWSVGRTGRTRTDGPPERNSFHGGPWAT